MIFGSKLDRSSHYLSDKTTSVPYSDGGQFAMQATFAEMVSPPYLHVTFTKDGGSTGYAGEFPLTAPTNDLSAMYYTNGYLPGHYVFTVQAGDRVIATGAIDVTP